MKRAGLRLFATLCAVALVFSCGGHSHKSPPVTLPDASLNPPPAQPASPEDDGSDGPLPDVFALDGCIAVTHAASEDEPITSQGWEATLNEDGTGTNGDPELNIEQEDTALTLRTIAPGEYTYAIYGQDVGAVPKPLRTLIASDVACAHGGRDEEIPLSYLVGVADYSIGSWRWFGPFGDVDVVVQVHSDALKSRFKSPSDRFYLVVLAVNGSKAASALPAEGLVADWPAFAIPMRASAGSHRLTSQDGEDDPGGLTIEEICTWVAEYLLTDPAIVTGLQATSDTSGVYLTWDTNLDPNVDIYQVFRDDLDDEDQPTLLQGVLAPIVEYWDGGGVPGKEYQYGVRARNTAGYGGRSYVNATRELVAPTVTASDTILDYIEIEWTAVDGAVGYKLYRGESDVEGDASLLAELDAETLSYSDTEPPIGAVRWYWVQALGADTDGPLSLPDSGIRAAVDTTPPVWTSGTGITSVIPGDSEVTVAWGEAVDAESPPVEYLLYVAESFIGIDWSTPHSTYSAAVLETSVGGLSNGTEYEFGVRARDSSPNENRTTNTNTLTATPGVSEPPEIISVSPTAALSGWGVQFMAEVSGSEPFTYSWDFGGGATPNASDEASPMVTLGAAGEYSASLAVTNAYGEDAFPFTLTVYEPGPGDWWMFGREPTHNRRSPYVGAQFARVKWTYETWGSSSSPAIGTDGTIYVGGDNYLYAINPEGSLRWRYSTGDYVRSSPAIGADGTIYVGSGDDYVYAINPSGTLKWRYATGGDVDSSPAIGADGTIFVGCDDGYLYAITDGGTEGTLKWRYETGDFVDSSPAIGADGTIYVGSCDRYLYAINPDGTLKWRYETDQLVESSPAIGGDGTIYVGTSTHPPEDGYLYAITDGGTEGTLKWRYETAGNVMRSSPAIGADGTLYVGTSDPADFNYYLYAITDNETEGALKWRYQTGEEVEPEQVNSSPAIGADGTIYLGVGSWDGYLYAITDSDTEGTLKWRYQTDGCVYSSPAIGPDGTVYVASNYLYAFHDSGVSPPTINSVSPTEGNAGTEVTFTADVEGDPPLSYNWDFWGAATPDWSYEESPTVTLTTPGVYNCSLDVTNIAGSDTFDFDILVN